MNKKTKRILALATVVTLTILSLINGNFASDSAKKEAEKNVDNYIANFVNDQETTKYIQKNGNSNEIIQKISVDGEITSVMTNKYNSNSVINQIKKAKEDPNVKAILISANTPGGGVYESVELYKALLDSGKDVYVSMKNYAASGGYYISMAAKKIYASDETVTGSIGVIRSGLSAQKFLNDHGIKNETIRSGSQKAVGGLTEDLNDETRKIYEEQIKESYDRFVAVIAKGRNMKEEDVRKLADGRTYSGTQAQKLGLIDKIATEDELINDIAKEKGLANPLVQETRVVKKSSFISNFVKSATKALSEQFSEEQATNNLSFSYLAQ